MATSHRMLPLVSDAPPPSRNSRTPRVCVFCGSSPGVRPGYREAAERFGAALVERGLGLVYGGASVGLMGVVADTVLAGGGDVIGVIPRSLVAHDLAHSGVADMRVVETLHERKALMAELSDAFAALPGGPGTLDELAEVITWAQLGLHTKPIGLLDVEGYFTTLLAFLDHAADEGFMEIEDRDLILVDDHAGRLLDRLTAHDGRTRVSLARRSRLRLRERPGI